MIPKIIFIIPVMIAVLPSAAQKKIDNAYFINLLNAGEYEKVFDSALSLRNGVYGKNAVVDYFIAKCLCLDGQPEKATYCFNKIISNFKLEGDKRSFIEKEIVTCGQQQSSGNVIASSHPDYSYISNITLPEASVGGKMGKVYNCFSGGQTINLTKMVSQQELESRLFLPAQKNLAVKKVRTIVGAQYKIDTARRYLFVTSANFPLVKVDIAANNLEKAFQFFVDYYNLRQPDKLLTVYISGNQEDLRKTARLVHGIELPLANIGYSNLSDLSLLGLGDAGHLGTLYHELFHLMIRTDVGDIPPFLDEGLASLYSVSYWENNQLKGDSHPWRLEELKEAAYSRDKFLKTPLLEKLINDTWSEFDGVETSNVCQVAVNYALSNFLMIYLQEKNLLKEMVTAYKDRPFVPLDSVRSKSNVEIFEGVVKDSIKTFAKKFDSWFYQQYHFKLYSGNEGGTGETFSMEQHIEDARMLLLVIEEKGNSYKKLPPIKSLRLELDSIVTAYRLLPVVTQKNYSNAPANMAVQNTIVDPSEAKRNWLQNRLMEFEKKLRKIIFDNEPKKAN